MKKKMIATLSLIVVMSGFIVLVACTSPTQTETNPSDLVSTPSLQPANHEGRFEEGGSTVCYGCHGAGDLANPILQNATIIPENHYTNQDYNTKELSVERSQCTTCHSVPGKE